MAILEINMKITCPPLIAPAALALILLSLNTAHAALEPRLGGQAIYDTDLNVTWLANANLAATNTFGVQGINSAGYMSWATAQNWIRAMNVANYLGFHDWKLPTTLQPDTACYDHSGTVSSGYNCAGSMMGHLFYTELGGVVGSSIIETHNADYSLFKNILRAYYWSNTSFAPSPVNAWTFLMNTGFQGRHDKTFNMCTWPVRLGDVAAKANIPSQPLSLGMNTPTSIPKYFNGTWTLDLKATERYITGLPHIENADKVAQGIGLAGGFLLVAIYEFNGDIATVKTFNPSNEKREYKCLPLQNVGIACTATKPLGPDDSFSISIVRDNALRIIFPRAPELNYLVWTREKLDPRKSISDVFQERINTSKEPFEHIMKYLNSQTPR